MSDRLTTKINDYESVHVALHHMLVRTETNFEKAVNGTLDMLNRDGMRFGAKSESVVEIMNSAGVLYENTIEQSNKLKASVFESLQSAKAQLQQGVDTSEVKSTAQSQAQSQKFKR